MTNLGDKLFQILADIKGLSLTDEIQQHTVLKHCFRFIQELIIKNIRN
jgi:hypothetical protein